jgi:hypothetical protein
MKILECHKNANSMNLASHFLTIEKYHLKQHLPFYRHLFFYSLSLSTTLCLSLCFFVSLSLTNFIFISRVSLFISGFSFVCHLFIFLSFLRRCIQNTAINFIFHINLFHKFHCQFLMGFPLDILSP